MRTRIVKIGNSQGIRIPKTILEQAGLDEDVDLAVESSSIVLRHVRRPGEGCGAQLKEVAAHGDDALINGDLASITNWDAAEWD